MRILLPKNTKGQVAMEYLAIFSIAALMIIPLIIIFVVQSQNIQADITGSQAEKAASTIISSAEEVYFMGEPAQKTIELQFPSGIEQVTISGTTMTFRIQTAELNYDIFKDARFNMTGNLDSFEGKHIITIKAQNSMVNITEK